MYQKEIFAGCWIASRECVRVCCRMGAPRASSISISTVDVEPGDAGFFPRRLSWRPPRVCPRQDSFVEPKAADTLALISPATAYK